MKHCKKRIVNTNHKNIIKDHFYSIYRSKFWQVRNKFYYIFFINKKKNQRYFGHDNYNFLTNHP